MAAGAPGQESTEGTPSLYNTNHELRFSYSEINFQDLSWSFRNLYRSMLERSSSSQHGESAVEPAGTPLFPFPFLFIFNTGSLYVALAGLELARYQPGFELTEICMSPPFWLLGLKVPYMVK